MLLYRSFGPYFTIIYWVRTEAQWRDVILGQWFGIDAHKYEGEE